MKKNIFGKNLNELSDIVAEAGWKKYRAKQIANWLYDKRITDINDMSTLSKNDREYLYERYIIDVSQPHSFQLSKDGTKKYLFRVKENKFVESVFIPESYGSTLCISSQVGCKMGCKFCMTGRQGFQGNLSSGEILNQFAFVPEHEKLTNIVYMGMGEPFDNYEEVMKSIEIITSDYGFGWSPQRITVSTIGLIPQMNDFLKSSKAKLAISMHSPFDKEREEILPLQKKYPIGKIIEELKKYDFSTQRSRISFEYIVFDGFNDSDKHVNKIASLLKDINPKVFNLIRFHEIPNCKLKPSPDKKIIEFRDKLIAKGINATIRASRGKDILAACGLLSTDKNKKQN